MSGQKIMISQKELKRQLHYNISTGAFTWVSSKSRINIGDEAGSVNSNGYFHITINGNQYKAHRLAWFYMTGEWPEQVDHINHDREDNRWCNLRCVSNSINGRNQGIRRTNTSGFMGVSWHKATCKWHSYIRAGGKQLHIGFFSQISDAVIARDDAEKLHLYHPNHGRHI